MKDKSYEIKIGDCIESLRAMPDQYVHCCVTSPPYFGLRDYGMAGQIGLEDTPQAFVARLVEVFREARRVLRDDGTLWLNLGDSYSAGNGNKNNQPQTNITSVEGVHVRMARGATPSDARANLSRTFNGMPKPKDLIGIPWRVAFALQDDGWYLRQEIIWHKPNPMPESVRDRCTKAHEQIFLLSKSPRYYFDADAIKEPAVSAAHHHKYAEASKNYSAKYKNIDGQSPHGNGAMMGVSADGMRNRRSVWTVTTKPFKGAHFATFPPDLIEPCILAGCPVGGTVLDPFGGSGTTAGVAIKHGRDAVLCELNPEYAAMIPARVAQIAGAPDMLTGVT